jgi:hypothetical protein
MDLLDKNFDYTYAITNRYDIPNQFIEVNNKKIKIELLVTNGFVKLDTIKGRLYGIAQINENHTLPDWKIHVNISHDDISKAWKIISESLLKYTIKYSHEKNIIDDLIISMKAININLNDNFAEHMSGREITIYIYIFDELLNQNNENGIEIIDLNDKGKEVKINYFFRKNDEEKFIFWYEFLIDIEEKLKQLKIKKKKLDGAADGDLWLGNYTSLRNESFVLNDEKKDYEYPPNNKGWNGAKKKKPFNWFQIYKIRYSLVYKETLYKNKLYIIGLLWLIIIFFLYKIL